MLAVLVAGYLAVAEEGKVDAEKKAGAAVTQTGAPNEGTTSPGKSDVTATKSGQPSEGIKVHGHWVIEVRDPDGTLVTRQELRTRYEIIGDPFYSS